MDPARRLVPLTLAVLVLACQDGNDPTTVESSPSPAQPLAADVLRFRFSHDGFFLHTTPDISFTIGLVSPLEDLPECGGTGAGFVSDLQGSDQLVLTPPGPEKQHTLATGTFVLYDVSLFDVGEDYCNLPPFVVGTGRGSLTKTDNSLTGVGPGVNAWGFMANAILTLTDGSKAKFTAIVRFNGGESPIVDHVTLTPIGN